jgi:glycosyltransferase involved in cell wall biosynthesis
MLIKQNNKLVSIIIPAYNEESSIERLLNELESYTSKFEIIVVNDASSDNTAQILNNFKKFKIITHPYNKGYGAALKTGIRAASGEYILTMDADGQHRPDEISKLLEYIDDFDMVVGAREKNMNKEWIRVPGKWVLSKVANYLSGMSIPDINSGFRLIRKECVKEFSHVLPNGFSFSTTITLALIHAGFDVKYVPIKVSHRNEGKSTVRQGRDGAITLLLITRCISLFNPLKIYIPAAIAILLPSILYALFGVIVYLSFPKTAIVGLLTGIIIIFFGILSDQIAVIRREPH